MNTATLDARPLDTAALDTAALLTWGDHLSTGHGTMDQTHHEFVDLLNRLQQAPTAAQPALYAALLDHTVAHFAQEDRWMQDTGFAPENCHTLQHASILDTMRTVAEHARQGDDEIIPRLAEALAEWFPQHAASMDAGLALHLQEVGYDCASGTLHDPSRLGATAPRTGCGSVGCG